MPRHYPPDIKAEALEILKANGGDITATHYRTGIPYRTLYAWRQELFLQHQTSVPLPQKELPEFRDTIEGLLELRQEIIRILLKLSAAPAPQASYMLVDRVRAQTGLVDCLLKLNAHLGPHLNTIQAPSWWDQAGSDYEPI